VFCCIRGELSWDCGCEWEKKVVHRGCCCCFVCEIRKSGL
jgi:hypothetical protein